MAERPCGNALEPQSLIDAFLEHPPQGFLVQTLLSGAPVPHGFLAKLDLFTAMDAGIRRRVAALRRNGLFDAFCQKCLTPRVFFLGTTVSEYCWLPHDLEPGEFAAILHAEVENIPGKFCIVKDLPVDSPFLSPSENATARKLAEALQKQGFVRVDGQALAYLPIDFAGMEEYLARLSKERRKDFRRKMKLGQPLRVEELKTGGPRFTADFCGQLYALYEHVYQMSDVHFDKLTLAFFRQVFQQNGAGIVFVYYREETVIGFNLCYVMGENLVDKYWGFSPMEAREHALFFNSFFYNIGYCLRHGLRQYIVGWTAAKAKASLGCHFTHTCHLVYAKNPLLRALLRMGKAAFAADKAIAG